MSGEGRAWSTTVYEEVRLEDQLAGVSQGGTGTSYLGIVKVLDAILGDHVISQLRRRKANRVELLGRQLGARRRQRLAHFRLDLPVGAVDAPLHCRVRIVTMGRTSGRKTHILPIAPGILAEEAQFSRATARPKALQLKVLRAGMFQAVDARLERSRCSSASVHVILIELPLGEQIAGLELAALAAQSLGHGGLSWVMLTCL